RPSRSRYKIYIIDEVHMLTNQAFNALLKTLEEPPEHVKFIFCTTDPEKVPITVLSRCQRFDFAPVRADAIKQRLQEICTAEGFEAEDDALSLLARRAAGSMRDSQSLLEQVMSFSSGKITTDQVHALLGTADETRLRELAEALANRDGVAALQFVDKAIAEGTDAGQFAEQMLGYLRDLMAVAVGGGPDLLKVCNPTGFDAVKQLADAWGLQTILAAVQLLDESLVRMRFSVQSQALFEVALIQITQLQDLATIAKIIEAVQHGGPMPAARPAAPPAAIPRPAVPAAAPPAAASSPVAPTPPVATSAEKKNVEGPVLSPVPNSLEASVSARNPGINETATTRESTQRTSTASPSNSSGAYAGANAVVLARPEGTQTPRQPSAPSTIQIRAAPLVSEILSSTLGTASTSSSDVHAAANDPALGATSSIASQASPAAQAALELWKQAARTTEGMLSDFAGSAIAVQLKGPDEWIVVFPPGTQRTLEYCDGPARRAELQTAIDRAAGRSIAFSFRVQPGAAVRSTTEVPMSPTVARSQRMRQLSEHPFVHQLCELLQGEVIRVDPPAAERIAPPHTNDPALRETAEV
ncbi:MAG: DNA polymerase III subunit gamma/tau, partial [Pirellulaceae bacterium]|nr:DNA polymerase III subunit gamma/tau [Pirellulaceae bacterium]